jgi:predicted RNase H-like HicB family nuclease
MQEPNSQAQVDDKTVSGTLSRMKGKFTAIIEEAPEGGYWAMCPEISGANGQGETVLEAKKSLRDAIKMILQDRLEDVQRGLPKNVIQTSVAIS